MQVNYMNIMETINLTENNGVITEMFYKGEQTMKNNKFKLKHIVVDYTLQV